jgi:hypothetical protein
MPKIMNKPKPSLDSSAAAPRTGKKLGRMASSFNVFSKFKGVSPQPSKLEISGPFDFKHEASGLPLSLSPANLSTPLSQVTPEPTSNPYRSTEGSLSTPVLQISRTTGRSPLIQTHVPDTANESDSDDMSGDRVVASHEAKKAEKHPVVDQAAQTEPLPAFIQAYFNGKLPHAHQTISRKHKRSPAEFDVPKISKIVHPNMDSSALRAPPPPVRPAPPVPPKSKSLIQIHPSL